MATARVLWFVRAAVFASTLGLSVFPVYGRAGEAESGGLHEMIAGGPRLGTWIITVKEAGIEYRSTMVLARRTGDVFDAYQDSTVKGGPMVKSLFSAEFNSSSGRIRFEQYETHTRATPLEIAGATLILEGTVSDDGTEILNIAIPYDPDCPRSNARWVSDATKVPDAGMSIALADTTERTLLYQQWSTHSKVDGIRVLPAADGIKLQRLRASSDPFIRESASVLQELSELALDSALRARGAKREFVEGIPAEVYKAVFLTIADSDERSSAIKPLVDLANCDLLQKQFKRHAAQLGEYILRQRASNRYCERLMEDFAARGAAQLPEPERFTSTFRNEDGGAVVSVRNNTGKILHNCVLRTRVVVDQARMDAHVKEYLDENLTSIAVFSLAGIDMIPTVEADSAAMAYHRLDKCVPLFVREWKAGEAVEFQFARTDALTAVGKSADLWIGSDEGVAARKFDMQGIRERLKATAAKPAPKPAAKPTPSAPKRRTNR